MTTEAKRVVPTTLEDLKELGFVEAPSEVAVKRAIVSITANDKEGKTDLGLSGKGPIAAFDIDVGTEGVIEKFKAFGRKIYVYRLRFAKEGGNQKLWEEQWDCDEKGKLGLKQALIAAWGLPEGTVDIDTFSEAYDLCRLARLGKLEQVPPLKYVEVNKEMRELVRLAYESKMSTVFIHKMKPEWAGGQKVKDSYELQGWGDIEYNTQLNLRPFTLEEKDRDGNPLTIFKVKVRNCRLNAKMTGRVYTLGKAGDTLEERELTLEKLIDMMYRPAKKKVKLDED